MAGRNSLFGPVDPAEDAGYEEPPPRKGFFTDTSVCIGCKACEVACKEWNLLPDDGFDLLGSSYDNTGALGANTWRHVAFVEQPAGRPAAPVSLGMPGAGRPPPPPARPAGTPPAGGRTPTSPAPRTTAPRTSSTRRRRARRTV
ncbi:hypothetical protein [Georgenia sp. SUBG003]|uniref:hypothetical protein n=1 Tax=Georgenia sp. SUBG003 TaxID=1497974 RepID=UPI003AB725C1